MAINACKAKKNIYLEKPFTFTIKEGLLLNKAVRYNGAILAVGVSKTQTQTSNMP